MKKETFEQRLNKVKKLAKDVESDNVKLDKLMDSFEKGIGLINELKKELRDYELKIEKVYKENDSIQIKQLKEEELLDNEF